MQIKSTFSCVLLLLMLYQSVSWANETLVLSQVTGRLITAVIIEGNMKTRHEVIRRELEFDRGDILSEDSVNSSLRKLKNLRIFEDVSIQYYAGPDDSVRIQVNVSDRWTVIPIAKFGGGGGSKFFTVGVYDVNSVGRHLEVGAQYQNINGKNGGVFWFRDPRLLGKRLLFGLDIWHFRQNQPIYVNNSQLFGAYNNTKNRLHVFLEKEFTPWFFFGGGLDVVGDTFDKEGLSDDQVIANTNNNFLSPQDSKQNFLEVKLQLGMLNYDKYLIDGFQTDIDNRFTLQQLGSVDNSAEILIKSTYFKTLSYQQNIGINVVFGHTSSSLTQNQFYLGGLFEVRGYVDRRFKGSDFIRSNIEYRVPSYRSRWFVLQHVAFADFGRIGNSVQQLKNNKGEQFSSVGMGLRFISPKIYRFNARLDFAKSFGKESNYDLSFGLQQFF